MRRHLTVVVLAATALLAATAAVAHAAPSRPARLLARAVLPARTFAPGPPSGRLLGSAPINGVAVPFSSQPVQGFSAALPAGEGRYWVMPDNGYGSIENSADFNLRVYLLAPDLKTRFGGPGTIAVKRFIGLRDPDHHSGTVAQGTPAIFGMNFQSVSTAEKLPSSDGQPGGYLADGVTPGPVLRGALDYVDAQVGAFQAALAQQRLRRSTAIILSAKHGQSPTTPSALTRIDDGPIIDGLNAAWKAAHPADADPLVAFAIDDDAMLLWLKDRSQEAADFARSYLLGNDGTGNDITGAPKPYTASGLARVLAGNDIVRAFGAAPGDPRRPDLYGIAQYGTVYTGGKGKIAEHGGADPQDVSVPLVLSGGPVDARGARNRPVETTQIAPTILRLLGLSPWSLQAVRIEGTAALPIGDGRWPW